MRKILAATALLSAVLFGLAPSPGSAQTSRVAPDVGQAMQNFSPVEKAACQGWGPYCPPGYVRACGPYRCWCRPCR